MQHEQKSLLDWYGRYYLGICYRVSWAGPGGEAKVGQAVGTRMPFCRDYFWTVNLSISNCVRPNTFQDAVFPLFCWHILQFLLHRRSLSYWESTTPSWRSRVGFRPWCTGWATCRHTWKWRLQWERETTGLTTVLRVGFYRTCPQSGELLGGSKWESWNKVNDPNYPMTSQIFLQQNRIISH